MKRFFLAISCLFLVASCAGTMPEEVTDDATVSNPDTYVSPTGDASIPTPDTYVPPTPDASVPTPDTYVPPTPDASVPKPDTYVPPPPNPYCGDGIRNNSEDCDTNSFGNATCQTALFGGGTLKCSSTCKFDYSDCTTGASDPSSALIKKGIYKESGIPQIAFNGTNFLVVWDEGSTGSKNIYGTRIAINGKILDPNGIPIATATGDQKNPSVTFDGTNFFVVWADHRYGSNNGAIFGGRVDNNGTTIDNSGFVISGYNKYKTEETPYIARATYNWGSIVMVVWTSQNLMTKMSSIMGARIGTDGTIYNSINISDPLYNSNNGYHSVPSVAFDGQNNFLVVWHRISGSSKDEIIGRRITKDGNVLDWDTNGIRITPNLGYYAGAYVANVGTTFLVVWNAYENNQYSGAMDIHAARVNSLTGVVLDPSGIPHTAKTGDQRVTGVASDGTNFFIVWDDDRLGSSNYDVYGIKVSTKGILIQPEIPITTRTTQNQLAGIAFGANKFLVAWFDFLPASGPVNLYGTFVTP